MNRLVLIDGNAMMHRAYHALPPLTAPDGTLVNAVYGFTSMLIKLFQDLKPTHMAVAFDRPEPTFRKTLFKEYQANRPELDSGMVSQFPIVRDVVTALKIPIYDAAGFEADDVLGTIAKKVKGSLGKTRDKKSQKAKDEADEVIIVTGDRDILQLVDDRRVKVFMPTNGLSEGKLFGEKEVKERMGVPPKQIADLKALAGDASDNYPGVGGIGPKTAVDLLKKYGSVENIYSHMGDKGNRGNKGKTAPTAAQKLIEGAESAQMGKKLATIRTDAPIDFKIADCRVETLDTLDARTKLVELHFPSLVKRLGGVQKVPEKKKEKTSKKPKEQSSQQQQLL